MSNTLARTGVLVASILAGIIVTAPSSLAAAPAVTAAQSASLPPGTVSPASYVLVGKYKTASACAAAQIKQSSSFSICRKMTNGLWYLYADDGVTD